MDLHQKKILIVGQGIAGTVLSFKLFQQNIDHHVLDNGHKSAATKAAAGLINPVTGRNYVKSWMVDNLISAADISYAQLGQALSNTYIKRRIIYRTLKNNLEYNNWLNSTSRPGYENLVDTSDTCEDYHDLVHTGHAYGVIKQGYQVDIARLITDYQEYLIERNRLLIESFDYKTVKLEAEAVFYNGEKYDLVIFSEGYRAIHNPFFQYLPFQPVKGESFTIDINEELPNSILRDTIFITPSDKKQFWTGGSYQHDFTDDLPTDKFRAEWSDTLSNLLKVPYQIKAHKAGVRPAVRGRKPLVGFSPIHPQLYIFNGMGTKATSLVPYWADHLILHLTKGIPIDKSVNINRFEINS